MDPIFSIFTILFLGFWLFHIALLIWVIYDVTAVQKSITGANKLFWIILAILLPIIGPIVYYFVVKCGNEGNVLPEFKTSSKSVSSVDTLERLAVLRDKGVISTEEFEEKKKKLMENI